MVKTHILAILAPVPEMHLLSAIENIARLKNELSDELIKTAFGSRDFELFRKADELRVDQSIEVFIYASKSSADQPLNSEASWHGLYIGHVNSRNGRYPGNPKFRPPSTITDKPDSAIFWEVQDLKPLTPPIKIGSLRGLNTKQSYSSRFIPEGPLLIEYP
jgi:hypothetical protein